MRLLTPDIYEEAAGLLLQHNSDGKRDYGALGRGLFGRKQPEAAQRMLAVCEELEKKVRGKMDLRDDAFSVRVAGNLYLGAALWLVYHRPGSGQKPSEYMLRAFEQDGGSSFVKAAIGLDMQEKAGREQLQRALFEAELSEAVKYRILQVWLEPAPAVERLCMMIERIAGIIKDSYEEYGELFSCAERFLTQPEAAGQLKKRISGGFAEERTDILPLLTGLNTVWEYEEDTEEEEKTGEKREVLGVGLLFFVLDCLEGGRADTAEELAAKLKCFTDETKLKILFLLAEKDCYQAEIARRLELTPATISHHLDALRGIGIVRAVAQDNRYFYELQRDRVFMIVRSLEEALGEKEGR